jgi:hypothetical protein
MGEKIAMPHLVIFLPGIMGSVLQKDGKDLWAVSKQAIWKVAKNIGSRVNELYLHDHDLERDQLDDGIRATRLIEEIYDIPNFIKGSGYRIVQERLHQRFELAQGERDNPQPHQNFFTFPYDWRRDIRVPARQLQRFIGEQLPKWRQHSGNNEAKVVLIGHSMGGLVARYYVEQLGGYPDVFRFYTLGTPHRGAPKTIDTLSNGIEYGLSPLLKPALEGWLSNLSKIVRSFDSTYQLLPIYEMVSKTDGGFARIVELNNIPNINQKRAIEARDVLVAISESALARHQKEHNPSGSCRAVIGINQDTYQTAFFESDGRLVLSFNPLPNLSQVNGDGTVPEFAATPYEVQKLEIESTRVIAQHHGWLPNGSGTLDILLNDLRDQFIKGSLPGLSGAGQSRRGINLKVEELYALGEPVVLNIESIGLDNTYLPLEVEVRQIDGDTKRKKRLRSLESKLSYNLEELPAGLYEISLRSTASPNEQLFETTSAFQVIDPKQIAF